MNQSSQPTKISLGVTALFSCLILVIIAIGVALISVALNAQAARTTATPTMEEAAAPSAEETDAEVLVYAADSTTLSQSATAIIPTELPPQTATPTVNVSPSPVIGPISTQWLTPSPTPRPTRTASPPFAVPMNAVTPNFRIIPDSELVNSPSASDFDIDGFVKRQPGIISTYSENVFGRTMSAADSLRFVSISTSVNPRILLALLEYRSHWVSNPTPDETTRTYAYGMVADDRKGFINQLFYAANTLNKGYYGYKTRGMRSVSLADKGKYSFQKDLNAGTVAVQYFLAQQATSADGWTQDISPNGVYATFVKLFGDPFADEIPALVPPDLMQPTMQLPFAKGEIWYFTGGPHGGWDHTGSAWGALDFAPPKPPDEVLKKDGPCYVSTYYARAVARGKIARARDGAVVLDLDMDGDERTGWTVLYLHIAITDRVREGTIVEAGDPIGHPSCQGFFLNSPGAHLHISRRYNGEWIATDCRSCLTDAGAPDFVMGGWIPRGDASGEVSMGVLVAGAEVDNAPAGKKLNLRDPISW